MPDIHRHAKFELLATMPSIGRLGPVNTNDDVVAAAPNEANQGARREVWWFQMNAEKQPSAPIWSAARRPAELVLTGLGDLSFISI